MVLLLNPVGMLEYPHHRDREKRGEGQREYSLERGRGRRKERPKHLFLLYGMGIKKVCIREREMKEWT